MDLGIPGLGPAIRIGIGGSAIVYRARQEKLNRDVAVKLLTNQDPAFVRRFEREAKMLGRLSRLPGIVTIHDSGFTTNDEPYLILEYCPSSLLNRVYRDGPYEPEQAAAIMGSVAATVAEAHGEGIIHRDLKPANILLTETDEPLISDFGISSVLGATGNMSTSVGFTPGYVAPETLTGKQGDAAVDVYALGATVFHLITGHAPFMGDETSDSNLLALANRIDSEPVPDLRPDGVPDHICAAIEWAMAKDPADRPTAARLAEGLIGEGVFGEGGVGESGVDRVVSPSSRQGGSRPSSTPVPDVGPGRPIGTGGPSQPIDAVRQGDIVSPRPSPDAPRPTRIDPNLAEQGLAGHGVPQPETSRRSALQPAVPPPPPRSGDRTPAGSAAGPKSNGAVAVLGVLVFGLMFLGLVVRGWSPSDGSGNTFANTTEMQWQSTTTWPPRTTATNTTGPPSFDGSVPTTVPLFPTTTGPPQLNRPALDFGQGSTPRPGSVTGYQDRWAAERAEIVFDLAGQYGLGADDVLSGPAGFEIDTTDCPANWSNTPGSVTATDETAAATLKLGFIEPAGNPDHQSLLAGIDAYFDWVNSNGGVGQDGTQLKVVTLPNMPTVSEQVEASGLLSIATLSTSTGLSIYDELNDSCIPHPFAAGGHPAWADPVAHPWTTGLERSYQSEAAAWVEAIERRVAGPSSVTILSADDDLAAIYEAAFRVAANESDSVALVDVVSVPPNQVSIVDGMWQAATGQADVLIAIASGPSCQSVLESASILGPEASFDVRLLNSDCFDHTSPDVTGFAADGWLLADDGLQATMPSNSSPIVYQPFIYNPFVDLIAEQLATRGLDPYDENHGIGFGLYGWAYHQALEISSRLPGGITRTNFILAQRSMSEMTVPVGINGIGFGVDGNDDAHFLEDAAILRLSAADRAWALQQVISLDGETPRCSWTPSNGCR